MEESPSPKKVGSWIVGNVAEEVPIPPLCSRLERWLYSRRFNPRCGPSSTLSKILDTPTMNLETIRDIDFQFSDLRLKSLDQSELRNSQSHNFKTGESKGSLNNPILIKDEESEDIEACVKKLSLTSTSSSIYDDHNNPFAVLLEICGQSAPSMLQDLFSRYRYVPCFLVTHVIFDFRVQRFVQVSALRDNFFLLPVPHFYSCGYNRCFLGAWYS
jgi:serine/threonine-protein kinase haspin